MCAGAVAPPQLLMVSGIGPADHLAEISIPLVDSLPGVSQNMRDHISVSIILKAKAGFPFGPTPSRQSICLSYTAEGSPTRNDMLITPISFSTAVQKG